MRVDALYPAQLSRPDLVVPHSPRFAWASRRSWLAAVWGAIGMLAGVSLGSAARPYVLGFLAVMVGYGLVNAVLRRRQAGFEPDWLAAQSEVLRTRRFEVLRLTISEPEDSEHGRRTTRRVYDLARPAEVARLLTLRARTVADGVPVPVTVEFSYPNEDAVTTGVERVRGELASIPIVGRAGAGSTPRVWFPAGRYLVQPAADRAVTYWVLGPPSLMVARPALDLVSVSPEED